MILAIVLLLASKPPVQDDGFGVCPAWSHYHMLGDELIGQVLGGATIEDVMPKDSERPAVLDGRCHDDKTDEPISERPKLPKPKFKPNPKDKWL